MFPGMTTQGGTYALVLASKNNELLRIGSKGMLRLQRGFYVYVGSAFGPGGLSARIKHHSEIAPRPHWHIDYLRRKCDLVEVWFSATSTRGEHAWAEAMSRLVGARMPMPGFGSSDCKCKTHLFWFRHRPSGQAFEDGLKLA